MSIDEFTAPGRKSPVRKYLAITGIALLLMLIAFVGLEIAKTINRVHQYGTGGDIKNISSAVESYRDDTGHYPVADSIEGLMNILSPEYLRWPLKKDQWNDNLHYESFEGIPAACLPMPAQQPEGCGPIHYALASAGSDGRFEHPRLRDYAPRDTRQFQCDIILRDGQFIQLPHGRQEFGKCMDP